RNAVQALGVLKSPRALEPLMEALKDRVPTVRERAAVGLGRIKDPRSIPALIEALMEEDKKSKVHFNEGAWGAIRKFGVKAGPHLAELFRKKPNPYLIDLLAESKYDGLAELLTPFTQHSDPQMREKALHALAQSGDPKSIDILLDVLESGDLNARINAVQSLGRLRVLEAAPKLLNVLRDDQLYGPQAGLYRAVADAFQEFSGVKKSLANAFPLPSTPSFNIAGAGTSLPELMGLLGNENFQKLNQMLSDAESRAGELSEKLDLPPGMLKAVSDQTWKFGAMFADARDAKTEQVKMLIDILQAGSPLVRASAALSLPWYMDPQALEHLEHAAQDPDEMVRRASSWAHAALKTALGYQGPNNEESSWK
ncbi:MAG TPA: HEAT repeat domain-containing protein, partial [Anaerolineales bacterium]|nr:HEAT repeat domain-containing protein [Anaerolineales bacterium]